MKTKKQRRKKPDKVIAEFTKETARLIRGELKQLYYKGLEISYRLYWESDRAADVDIENIKFHQSEPTTPLEELFFDYFKSTRRTLWEIEDTLHDDILECIMSGQDYQRFNAKIKDLCYAVDEVEKTSNLDFHTDILDQAQSMANSISII